MEEKKLDINSIIGFALIFGILMYMLWQNQPTPEELKAQEEAKQEQVEKENNAKAQEETKVTTTSITDDKASILMDQFTFNDPELIHVEITKLFSYLFNSDSFIVKFSKKEALIVFGTKTNLGASLGNRSSKFLTK